MSSTPNKDDTPHDPFRIYHDPGFEFRRQYKLRGGIMRFDGAPVAWNGRSWVWRGTDWREPIRYRLRRWLPRPWTDDRQIRTTRTQALARRLLGTSYDVEARRAGHYANRWLRDSANGIRADRGVLRRGPQLKVTV